MKSKTAHVNTHLSIVESQILDERRHLFCVVDNNGNGKNWFNDFRSQVSKCLHKHEGNLVSLSVFYPLVQNWYASNVLFMFMGVKTTPQKNKYLSVSLIKIKFKYVEKILFYIIKFNLRHITTFHPLKTTAYKEKISSFQRLAIFSWCINTEINSHYCSAYNLKLPKTFQPLKITSYDEIKNKLFWTMWNTYLLCFHKSNNFLPNERNH